MRFSEWDFTEFRPLFFYLLLRSLLHCFFLFSSHTYIIGRIYLYIIAKRIHRPLYALRGLGIRYLQALSVAGHAHLLELSVLFITDV